jgi:hypothetical protein
VKPGNPIDPAIALRSIGDYALYPNLLLGRRLLLVLPLALQKLCTYS